MLCYVTASVFLLNAAVAYIGLGGAPVHHAPDPSPRHQDTPKPNEGQRPLHTRACASKGRAVMCLRAFHRTPGTLVQRRSAPSLNPCPHPSVHALKNATRLFSPRIQAIIASQVLMGTAIISFRRCAPTKNRRLALNLSSALRRSLLLHPASLLFTWTIPLTPRAKSWGTS